MFRVLFEVISSFPKIEGKVKSVMACDQRMSNKKGFCNGCRKEGQKVTQYDIQYVHVFALLAFGQKYPLISSFKMLQIFKNAALCLKFMVFYY